MSASLASAVLPTAPLIALMLHGIGMPILECLRLWVRGIDFDLGILAIQEFLGHYDGKPTMIRTHILQISGGRGIMSPVDTIRNLGEARV